MEDLKRKRGEVVLMVFKRPTSFRQPKTIHEACLILASVENSRVMAGGTDLIPDIKNSNKTVHEIVDIKGIAPSLRFVQENKSIVKLGALSTISDVACNSIVATNLPVLVSACRKMGTPQVRNRATVGGNICNGSPAADLVTCLMALDAEVEICSLNEVRTECLREFFIGPKKTILTREELLTGVFIKVPPPNVMQEYIKITPRSNADLAILNLSVLVQFSPEKDKIIGIRLAFGGMAPTVVRAWNVEKFLEGKLFAGKLLDEACRILESEVCPISDIRASKEYRLAVSKEMLIDGILGLRGGNVQNGNRANN